jgi:hypothetical protein
MVLMVLRAVPEVRSAVFTLSLLILLSASGSATLAQQPPAHKKPATASHTHKKTHAKTPARHSQKRVPERVPRRSTRSAPARPKAPSRPVPMVRTRVPVRHSPQAATPGAARPADRVPVARDGTEERAAESAGEAASGAEEARAEPGAAGLPVRAPESTTGLAPGPAAGGSVSRAVPGAVPAGRVPPALPKAAAPFPGGSSIVAEAPLRGSLDSLVRQNLKTDADNLERIEDDADLRNRVAEGLLVALPVSTALAVNPKLDPNRRYCRPWTATFLADISHAHEAAFHHPLVINSAVRTVEYQKELMRKNGNAAAAEGDVVSPHLTGATIDIAKKGLSRAEVYWMRDRLNLLEDAGKIDVEEEFHQACFHITVYKSYIGSGPPHRPVRSSAPPPTGEDPPEPDDEPQHS